jgi:LysW-gamma-L-lysine carboxypeptidase
VKSHAPTDAEVIALLERLVSIESPSGQEAAVAQAAVETMTAWGFDAHVDAVGNAVGCTGQGGRTVLLLGHIDTVPGHVPVRRVGDLLYGRGAVDAKGPFAAFVCAAARAAAGGLARADLRIVVVGAVEEEAATSAGAYHVVAHHSPADAVVIGEPSRWDRVTLGYKGRLLVDYRLEQPVSHTAGQAVAVCEQAVAYWLAVRDWATAYNRDQNGADAGAFATLDPSLRALRSDGDGLREWVEMRIGLRLPLGLDIDALEANLTGPWAGEARVTLHGREEPFRADKRNELTGAFLAAVRAEGGRAAFVTKTGTSDMNVIGPRWGCPIVAYGPGDSAYDHTPDEQINLDEYLRAIRVLTGALQRLSETLGRRG